MEEEIADQDVHGADDEWSAVLGEAKSIALFLGGAVVVGVAAVLVVGWVW